MKKKLCILLLLLPVMLTAQDYTIKIARLKYRGGGDWYVSPTSLPNLIKFCNEQLGTNIKPQEDIVEAGSPEIFNYPLVHMTGHGNVIFNDQEAENIRAYLIGGGFLNINDSYGMKPYIMNQMKKVFPELEWVELPFEHPIYHQKFNFPNGLPKIHEHDGKPPQGFGLIYEGRLVCFFNYESDIGDGWEDPEVHHDPEEKRQEALKMGANIVQYAFTH
ncbi:MAG: hypothetical protein KatS3mg031_1357 [Chitinophagales bacterium]|nr:MAG: hypothetical protein KatS3mg031_1357 [Chitinophagales bacterium]